MLLVGQSRVQKWICCLQDCSGECIATARLRFWWRRCRGRPWTYWLLAEAYRSMPSHRSPCRADMEGQWLIVLRLYLGYLRIVRSVALVVLDCRFMMFYASAVRAKARDDRSYCDWILARSKWPSMLALIYRPEKTRDFLLAIRIRVLLP